MGPGARNWFAVVAIGTPQNPFVAIVAKLSRWREEEGPRDHKSIPQTDNPRPDGCLGGVLIIERPRDDGSMAWSFVGSVESQLSNNEPMLKQVERTAMFWFAEKFNRIYGPAGAELRPQRSPNNPNNSWNTVEPITPERLQRTTPRSKPPKVMQRHHPPAARWRSRRTRSPRADSPRWPSRWWRSAKHPAEPAGARPAGRTRDRRRWCRMLRRPLPLRPRTGAAAVRRQRGACRPATSWCSLLEENEWKGN